MSHYQELWAVAGRSDYDYLSFARAYIKHKQERRNAFFAPYNWATGAYTWRPNFKHHEYNEKFLIDWLYELALDMGRFKQCTFEDFKNTFEQRPGYYNYYVSPYWRGRRAWYQQAEFRERLSFHYKGESKKADYNQKEEYRRASGLYRDKAKRNGHRWGSMKKNAKKEFNIKFRREERRLLKAGKWEKITPVLRRPWWD